MKIVILAFFALILLIEAKQVTNDANSPVVSELQESKVAVKLINRNTRQATENSSCPDSASSCQSKGVVTYVRWGNSNCSEGANMIYSGVVAGSYYNNHGTAAEPLCLPPDPQYLLYQSGYQNFALIYGAEYETHANSPLNQAHNRNIPCALCQVFGRTNKIMIPSHYECPSGWTREYYGYLMAGHVGHNTATQFTCIDKSVEQIQGSGSDTNGRLFYTVEAVCNQFIPCSDKELTCAVCTR